MKRLLLMMAMTALVINCMAQRTNPSYTTVKDISYISDSDTSAYRRERCKLDIYYPEGAKDSQVLIWFHGGGLNSGNKQFPWGFQGKNICLVSVNYRLAPRAKAPDYIVDAAEAVAWVFKNIEKYGGSAKRINISGHSAGGYLTLILCLDKSYLSRYGIDADDVEGYYPISGETITHFTIREEMGIPFLTPYIDQYAPIFHSRKLGTKLVLFTGDRRLELPARCEENMYLKDALERDGNEHIPMYEFEGFTHGTCSQPAIRIMQKYMFGEEVTEKWD